MPVRLNTIPDAESYAAPPARIKWLSALLLMLSVGVAITSLFASDELAKNGPHFWGLACGVPAFIWSLVASVRWLFFITQYIRADAWNKRREEVILQETRRGRRALQILSFSVQTALNGDSVAETTTAFLARQQVLNTYADLRGEDTVRRSVIPVLTNKPVTGRLSEIISRLFIDIRPQLFLLPPDFHINVLLEIDAPLSGASVRTIWQDEWQKAGLPEARLFSAPEPGLAAVDDWLDNFIQEKAVLLVISVYLEPKTPERTAESSTALLLANRLTQTALTGFEIDVVLNENWPHDLPFDSDNIRLHCVPVINLFPLEADPLHLSPLENEFLLRPMRIQDGHTEIYSVDNIISSRHTGSQAYVPFSSFRHRGGMLRHDAPERYYHTRVKRGPSGLHDTWLILGGDAFDADRMLEDETLSLSLTGTNGHLPRKALQSTLLDRPVHASQNVLRVRNLCAPTQPCYPPARDRFHWRVLSHLGSNFLSMMDNAEILRGTLALYDWTESEMNRRRLEAIVDVQHSLIQRFERGFLLRGVDIQVTLDSNGFAGEGDITLFGELLHRFFALYADIHLFTQLTLILQPTGKCLQWTEHHSQRVPG